MNIYELLAGDHRRIVDLLDSLERTRGRDAGIRSTLFARLEEELIRHVRAEEEVFFPAVLDCLPDAPELVFDAMEEHARVLCQLATLDGLPYDDAGWLGQLRRLRAQIEAHVGNEEEVLFTLARERLSERDARALAAQASEVTTDRDDDGSVGLEEEYEDGVDDEVAGLLAGTDDDDEDAPGGLRFPFATRRSIH